MEKVRKSNLGCLITIGLAFLLPGLSIFVLQLQPLWKSWRINHWLPVPAYVVEVNQTIGGEDATNYGVTGSFKYQISGREYHSTQLNFYSLADNVGDYQKSFYQKLQSARSNNRTITAYYNPDNPSEAILDKTMRWEMLGFGSIFLLVFGGVGVGLIVAGFYSRKKSQAVEQYKSKYKDQPWRWKPEWQYDHIKPSIQSASGLGFFAILWCLISFPLGSFFAIDAIETKQYGGLFSLIFPLVGCGLVAAFIIAKGRIKKYGNIKLFIDGDKLTIGAKNNLKLDLGELSLERSDALVNLVCVHRYETGASNDRTIREELIWEDTVRANWTMQTLPLNFYIPNDLPESDEKKLDTQYYWRLMVYSDQPGLDLKTHFDVPVFKLSDAEKEQREIDEMDLFSNDESDNGYEQPSYLNNQARGDWTQLGASSSVTNQGNVYEFPAFKNKASFLVGFIIGTAFVAIGLWVYSDGAPIIFPIVFGFLGGLVALISISIILFKSRITTSSGRMKIESGYLFFTKSIEVNSSDIETIDINSNVSQGSKKYYNINLHTKSGVHALAKTLLVKGDVDDFIQQIKSDIGL